MPSDHRCPTCGHALEVTDLQSIRDKHLDRAQEIQQQLDSMHQEARIEIRKRKREADDAE